MVPTVHANWRYFEMYDDSGKNVVWWWSRFNILFEEDARHFHQTKPLVTNPEFYPKYKSGTHIAMKHVELADCSIIAKLH
jgi:coproporphyrinogen III oxidase